VPAPDPEADDPDGCGAGEAGSCEAEGASADGDYPQCCPAAPSSSGQTCLRFPVPSKCLNDDTAAPRSAPCTVYLRTALRCEAAAFGLAGCVTLTANLFRVCDGGWTSGICPGLRMPLFQACVAKDVAPGCGDFVASTCETSAGVAACAPAEDPAAPGAPGQVVPVDPAPVDPGPGPEPGGSDDSPPARALGQGPDDLAPAEPGRLRDDATDPGPTSLAAGATTAAAAPKGTGEATGTPGLTATVDTADEALSTGALAMPYTSPGPAPEPSPAADELRFDLGPVLPDLSVSGPPVAVARRVATRAGDRSLTTLTLIPAAAAAGAALALLRERRRPVRAPR
jgi:hypothetical protein